MNTEEIVKLVNEYQNITIVHHLTCGVEGCREELAAGIKSGQVVLKCPSCGYEQTRIPEIFFKEDYTEQIDEIKEMEKMLEKKLEKIKKEKD